MEYYVYVLESVSTGRYYIGQTADVSSRLVRHNAGYVKSTKGRGPWRVKFSKCFTTRAEAMRVEQKLKRMKSRKRVEQWIISHSR